jgi:GAF domain-containing protein
MRPPQEEVLDAVRAITAALTDEPELDRLLHLIAERMCAVTGISRCSIHLRDESSGLYKGQVGHATRDIDRDVKRMIAGLPADRFTREILETKKPVLLSDAVNDPRGIRSSMIDWNVRSVLGVPMLLRSEVIGIIFLDNEDEPYAFSESDQKLASVFAELAAAATVQTQLVHRLRATLSTVAHQNDIIKRASHLEGRLTAQLLRGSSVAEIAAVVAALSNNPCVIYGAGFEQLAENRPDSDGAPLPRLLDDSVRRIPVIAEGLAAAATQPSSIIGPLPSVGLRHRLLLAPVRVQDELWGYLVVVERGTRLDSVDALFVRRAARSLALQLSATRRAAGDEWRVGESLASGLIRGDSDAVSLQQRADMLGVRLNDPRVICLVRGRPVGGRDDRAPGPRLLAESLGEGMRRSPLAAGIPSGTVVLLDLPDGATKTEQIGTLERHVAEVLEPLAPGGGLFAAISPICTEPAQYETAFQDAEDVMRCLEGYVRREGNHVLSADRLGAGRLFLSAAGGERGRRFARDTLGPLLLVDNTKMHELLVTLTFFLACSRHVSATAEGLGVHKNTVRYRLGRIRELTGLDVLEDADAQLAAHMSLIVLRLEGALPDAEDLGRPERALAAS